VGRKALIVGRAAGVIIGSASGACGPSRVECARRLFAQAVRQGRRDENDGWFSRIVAGSQNRRSQRNADRMNSNSVAGRL